MARAQGPKDGGELAVQAVHGGLELLHFGGLRVVFEREREVMQPASAKERRTAFDGVRDVAQGLAIAVDERLRRLSQAPAILLDEVADEFTQQCRVERLAALTHGFKVTE